MKKLVYVIAALIMFSATGCGSADQVAIQGSGQIEAQQITIAPEQSGRVVEVLVDEGDDVRTGDPLFRIDDSMLLAQQQAAQAALDSANASVLTFQAAVELAQAQYEIALSAALAQDEPFRHSI